MGVVGLPVGTEKFERDFSQGVDRREATKSLVRVLVPMEDAQTSSKIQRLSTLFPHVCHTLDYTQLKLLKVRQAHSRKRFRTYQQRLDQTRSLHRLPPLGPGAVC